MRGKLKVEAKAQEEGESIGHGPSKRKKTSKEVSEYSVPGGVGAGWLECVMLGCGLCVVVVEMGREGHVGVLR